MNWSIAQVFILVYLNVSVGLGQKPCSNFTGIKPEIIIQRYGSSEHLPSVNSVESNDKSALQRKQIKCVHTSPIEWIVDVEPSNFDMRRNLFWKNAMNTSNESTYSAHMVFMYSPKILKSPVLFSCQPVILQDECERHFLEVKPGTFSPKFHNTSVPSTKMFEDLRDKLMAPVPEVGNKSSSECGMLLNIKGISGNSLEYKWEILKGNALQIEIAKTTNQPSYFRGMYRQVKTERNCVKFLEQNETCNNCKIVADLDGEVINSVTFYSKSDQNEELVYKGVFNLSIKENGARHFYLDYELPLEEMIYLQVPPTFYVNHTVKVYCSVSVLYFAYGTILAYDEDRLRNEPGDEVEVYKEDGRREISRNFTFYTGDTQVTIYCLPPLLNFTRRFSVSQKISVQFPEAPSINGSFANERIILSYKKGISDLTFSCSFLGNPLPTVEWRFPNSAVEDMIKIVTYEEIDVINSRIEFPPLTPAFVGTYNCTATNFLGTVSKTINIDLPSEGLSTKARTTIGISLAVFIVACVIVIFFIYRRIVRQRQEYRTKTAEAVEEFKKGISQKEGNDGTGNLQHHKSIFEQPYNDEYEIPSDKWVIEDKVLGQGAFGIVKKGSIEIKGLKQQIAIKMLKSSVEIEDFKSFLFELKIMAYLGAHANIVSLTAACTQNIDQRDIMIGVEFCSNGSLFDYLIGKKDTYQALFSGKKGLDIPYEARYQNVISTSLTELDLHIWAYQIANGMEFLGLKKVLHGDLATRNVLLTFDKTAKISDFGLSRVLLDSSNYTKKSRVPLPWKWMGPESLRSMIFSSASDVWAYGVTVWEMFSLGEAPYAGLHFDQEFIQKLENGLVRPLQPTRASDNVYKVMQECWTINPRDRPTFSDLKATFSQILTSLNNQTLTQGEAPIRPLGRSPIVQRDQKPVPHAPLDIAQLYANIARNQNLYLNS